MGFLNDALKMKRDVDKFINTAEKVGQSAQQLRINQLQNQFNQGQTSATKFERSLRSYTDESITPIQFYVEQINGVGKSTSEAIDQEYSSLEDLLHTDREQLESVSGVGKATADSILEYIK